jgi:hypothetical protein
VFVPALKVLAGIAQQKATGGHQIAALIATVLERSLENHGDGDLGVLFFESAILRASRANRIRDHPSGTLRHHARGQPAGPTNRLSTTHHPV